MPETFVLGFCLVVALGAAGCASPGDVWSTGRGGAGSRQRMRAGGRQGSKQCHLEWPGEWPRKRGRCSVMTRSVW